MKLKLLTIITSILTTFLFTNVKAQCIEIESILADACGSPEGTNEMVRLKTGATPLDINNIFVDWPNPATGFNWHGACQNANTSSRVSAINASILGCGYVLEPPLGIIPPNSTVIIVTSDTMDVSANNFTYLNDTIYMVFQCAWTTQGHFVNWDSSPAFRTLVIGFSSPANCSDTVHYDRSLLTNIYGGSGGTTSERDGASISYTPSGAATYYNNGCQAPITTTSAAWSFTDKICNTHATINLNTLLAPNATTGGTWTGTNVNTTDTTYTPGALGIDSITYSITSTGTCSETVDSTIVFEVVEEQQGILNLQSCDSLNYGGNMYYANTTFIVNIANSNPYYCDSNVQVNIAISNAFEDSVYISGCDSVLYNGSYYYSDTLLKDTILGGGSGSTIDTILHTGFEDSEGWTDHNTGNWTQTDSYGTWQANGMYANQFNPNTGIRNIGMNTVGDFIQLPPVNNPTTFTYYDRLSGSLTGTNVFALEYFDGTNWIEIGRDTCTHTNYEIVSIDVSSLSALTNVAFRIYRTNHSRSGYIDDITIYGQIAATSTCDSIHVAQIIILQRDTTYATSTSCNPADTGVFVFNGFNSQNCDSIHYDTVTLASYSSAIVAVVECDSALANGNWYYTNTSFDVVIPNGAASGCDSVTTYNIAILNPIMATIMDTTGCDSVNIAGTWYYTNQTVNVVLNNQASNSCDSIVPYNIIILQNNTVTVVDSFCVGASYTLNGGTVVTSGGSYSDIVGNGTCSTTYNYTLTEIQNPVVDLGTDITTCNTNAIIDASTSNATYIWQDNTTTTATYNATSTGLYYVDVTVNSCTTRDSINITIIPLATGQETATICIGDSIFLENAWQTQAGNYSDTVNLPSGCDSVIITTLIVENPQLNITDDITICNGLDMVLQANSTDSVFWSTGETVPTITVLPNTTTTYIATAISPNGCTAQDSVVVAVVDAISNVTISATDTLIDAGEQVMVTVLANNVQNYEWLPITGFSNEITDNPQITTTYIVTLSNNPCPNVLDSITVQVNPPLIIEPSMPTAFSPNGDSVNDVFRPANYDMFSSYLLKIYNRWGELIYEDKGYGVAWDGNYKAKLQNVDVYVYYIEATPLNSNDVVISSGNLTLVK